MHFISSVAAIVELVPIGLAAVVFVPYIWNLRANSASVFNPIVFWDP